MAPVEDGIALNCDARRRSEAAIITDTRFGSEFNVATVTTFDAVKTVDDLHDENAIRTYFICNGALSIYGPFDIPQLPLVH